MKFMYYKKFDMILEARLQAVKNVSYLITPLLYKSKAIVSLSSDGIRFSVQDQIIQANAYLTHEFFESYQFTLHEEIEFSIDIKAFYDCLSIFGDLETHQDASFLLQLESLDQLQMTYKFSCRIQDYDSETHCTIKLYDEAHLSSLCDCFLDHPLVASVIIKVSRLI